jgi:hypothetical protein
VDAPTSQPAPPPLARVRRRWLLPAVLFLATCLSTFWAGAVHWAPERHFTELRSAAKVFRDWYEVEGVRLALTHAGQELQMDWRQGLLYMVAAMGILLTHELGHFLVVLGHGIHSTPPLFIPMPVLPFGTFGAIIGLDPSKADRRRLFDLGVSGPLAGLAVTLPVLCLGVWQLQSHPAPAAGQALPSPLALQFVLGLMHPGYSHPGVLWSGQMNPLLMAGWLGLLMTGMNMLPLSQLDGGHVAYAMFGRRAHWLARALLIAGIGAVLVFEAYSLVIMLVLIVLIGVDHPPSAADDGRLGWPRLLLGWLSLAIPVLCFPWGFLGMK